MKADDIKRVLILGSGTMGQQIGYLCALHGLEVVIYDISEEILQKAARRIRKSKDSMSLYGRFTPEAIAAALARISYSSNPQKAAEGIQLISESVPEDPLLKGRVLQQFNALCPPETIFTTNTSSLVPSMFAEATGRPQKFCALHFHVVSLTNIVDVMPHGGTAPETVELVTGFARKIGQIPIVMNKENNGYVYNFMLMALLESALTLASRGIVTVEDVDRAWMGVMRAPMGPFGIIDTIGLATAHKITEFWAKVRNDKKALANAEFLRMYVDQGKLGIQSGEGFYTYPQPAYADPDFVKG